MPDDFDALHDRTLDDLAEMIETADSYLVFSNNPFMDIVQLKDAYLHGLQHLRDKMFELYTDLGGEDVWND